MSANDEHFESDTLHNIWDTWVSFREASDDDDASEDESLRTAVRDWKSKGLLAESLKEYFRSDYEVESDWNDEADRASDRAKNISAGRENRVIARERKDFHEALDSATPDTESSIIESRRLDLEARASQKAELEKEEDHDAQECKEQEEKELDLLWGRIEKAWKIIDEIYA